MTNLNLFNVAKEVKSNDITTKALSYYAKYDNFLSHHEVYPKTILEIGVHQGESTKIFSKVYPNAKIVAIDIVLNNINFSQHPNVTYLQSDQINSSRLIEIINEHFPDGIDLVIEDASHYGSCSKVTFDTVFPFVKSNGAYFIEDWGTGYWSFWSDGAEYTETTVDISNGLQNRIPSHDYGMVGFVKSLVDMTHECAILGRQNEIETFTSKIKVLEFGEGVCLALKG